MKLSWGEACQESLPPAAAREVRCQTARSLPAGPSPLSLTTHQDGWRLRFCIDWRGAHGSGPRKISGNQEACLEWERAHSGPVRGRAATVSWLLAFQHGTQRDAQDVVAADARRCLVLPSLEGGHRLGSPWIRTTWWCEASAPRSAGNGTGKLKREKPRLGLTKGHLCVLAGPGWQARSSPRGVSCRCYSRALSLPRQG